MKENKYTRGLVSVSFRKHTLEEIIKAAKNAGLSCIEWGSDVHAPFTDTANLYEIAKLQQECGLYCSSYGTYFKLGQTPISELSGYISAAKILGTDILRLWCGTKSGKEFSAQEKQEFLKICKKAAEIAKKENVILCMECHNNSFTEQLDDAMWLMENVDSPNFKMYWQPFQWQTIEENEKYAEKIAKYAMHIHVFQWKNKERFPLKDGIKEWQTYLSKFSGSRTLLLEFMPDDQIDSLPEEAKALKTITGE